MTGREVETRKIPTYALPAVQERLAKVAAHAARLVMLVQDDRGFKVWGSVPSSISEAGTGDRVTFSATIEASDKEDFGFFKRPTKAQILAAA